MAHDADDSALNGTVEPDQRPAYFSLFKNSYVKYLKEQGLDRSASIADNRAWQAGVVRALISRGGGLLPAVWMRGDGSSESGDQETLDYQMKHQGLTLYTHSAPGVIRKKAQILLDLPANQLAHFITQFPQLLNIDQLNSLIHSVRLSALNDYQDATEPIVLYLTDAGWDVIQRIRDALVSVDVLGQAHASNGTLDYPGLLNLGQGLYYAELPLEAAESYVSQQQAVGKTMDEAHQSLSHLNVLAALFAKRLNSFMSRQQLDSDIDLKTLTYQESGRGGPVEIAVLFVGGSRTGRI